jgi:hypothetical protein
VAPARLVAHSVLPAQRPPRQGQPDPGGTIEILRWEALAEHAQGGVVGFEAGVSRSWAETPPKTECPMSSRNVPYTVRGMRKEAGSPASTSIRASGAWLRTYLEMARGCADVAIQPIATAPAKRRCFVLMLIGADCSGPWKEVHTSSVEFCNPGTASDSSRRRPWHFRGSSSTTRWSLVSSRCRSVGMLACQEPLVRVAFFRWKSLIPISLGSCAVAIGPCYPISSGSAAEIGTLASVVRG